MMKRLLAVVAATLAAGAALAATWTDDRGFTWSYSISGNAATITGISPTQGEMPPIPSELGGKPVTTIGQNAFKNCTGLTGALTFPDCVTSIGSYAFYDCEGLTELAIPDNVKKIEDNAFKGCGGLTSITIGNGVMSIGDSAFSYCRNLASLTLGNSVTNIGSSAFYVCNLTGLLTIPEGVKSIGRYAFNGNSGLTGPLTLPNSVTSIGENAFAGCSGFTGPLTLPNGLTTIETATFYGCSGLTGSLTIPGSVISIGFGAFKGCSGFTGPLIIPESVRTICGSIGGDGNSWGAFDGCSGFTGSLTIPGSVTNIGDKAFSGCSGFSGELTIQEGVLKIGSSAFSACTRLTAVSLPATIESLGNYPFSGDKGIMSVRIAEGATTVGGFSGCTGLVEVELPNSVTNITDFAFSSCIELVNLNLPVNLKKIGNSAFDGCTKLQKLEWPEGVTVGMFAFRNCKSWQGTFTVPDGVTEIADGVFQNCSGLQQINLPKSLTRVGDSVFSGCGALKRINLPHGLTNIGVRMFYYCQSLAEIVIPGTVNVIGNQAFAYCTSLKTLVVPEGVTTLNGESFYRSDVNVQSQTGSGGFLYRSGVTSIILPSTLFSVYAKAFQYAENLSMITFMGDLPVGYELWSEIAGKNVAFTRASGGRAFVTWPVTQFMGYTQTNAPTVTIISSKIRENDPEVMDVVFKVNSTKPTVKVRALAFENGVRSFANVVRPEDFIADLEGNETKGNIGDVVTANVEHTLSWKVSSDWATRLAKVSFEVLATEDDILPLELMTIPGTPAHPETWQISWNYITADKSFEALLWLYADKDLGLTLREGVLYNGDTRLCEGAQIKQPYDALVYIYGKMGFTLLDGDALDYVREATRFALPNKSSRQYAYRVVTPAGE